MAMLSHLTTLSLPTLSHQDAQTLLASVESKCPNAAMWYMAVLYLCYLHVNAVQQHCAGRTPETAKLQDPVTMFHKFRGKLT